MILFFFPLVLLFSPVASTSHTPGPLHISIARRSNGVRSMEFYSAAAAHLRGKYNYHHGNRLHRRAAGVLNMAIVNQLQDSTYYGTVSIGTPRKVTGQIATDAVTMGEFTINPQTFLLVDQAPQDFIDVPVSGLMGLAFDGASKMGAMPFWQALALGGQLTAPEMGFWLTRFMDDLHANDNEPGGAFTLGGTNSTLFQGDIDFVGIAAGPQQSNTFWMLNMVSVTVQGRPVHITSGQSALSSIDTGTTLISGPTKDVSTIWKAVPGARRATDMPGFWVFPCATVVSISLSFGSKLWPINPADMNLGRVFHMSRSRPLCLGAIVDLGKGSASRPGDPSWVVGDTFLKNVYSVFRMAPPSVGFAQLSVAADSSDLISLVLNDIRDVERTHRPPSSWPCYGKKCTPRVEVPNS
ncbi:aspartic peptidase domain-containing protein [Infundibulicybe gibba]|nr:aspartic peptidase domain-containing protein [Infundibulicybe gibba]